MGDIDEYRDRMCAEMKELMESKPDSFVNAAVDCHLRPSAQAQKSKGGSEDDGFQSVSSEWRLFHYKGAKFILVIKGGSGLSDSSCRQICCLVCL